MVSPLIVSNNFILRAAEHSQTITPMKLQKLLYLLYARFLAETDRSLFSDRFEKWQYGPVLSEVYTAFKKYGSGTITTFCPDSNGEVLLVDESHAEFRACFDDVWDRYGCMTGITLSNITHQENSAWTKVRHMGDFLRDEDIRVDGERFFAG